MKREKTLEEQLITRLNKIEGQVRGIRKMIEDGRYCDDVFTQISSVKSSLNGVNKLILDDHIRHCVVRDLREGRMEVINELLQSMDRVLKQ